MATLLLHELVDKHRGARSYERIAHRAAITRQYLYLLCLGDRTPSKSVCSRLGRALGISARQVELAGKRSRGDV